MFVFEDEFNPGDGRMRCATGVAAIVRMGPHWSTLALSIKSRREGGREGGEGGPYGTSAPGRLLSWECLFSEPPTQTSANILFKGPFPN